MMAERLAEIRRDLYTEAYTSYPPKTVRELLDYIDGLKFANGVLDSAAKDAQAWSYEAQTAKEAYCELLEANRVTEEAGGVIAQLNGMIDELRAQLEAQADESSATMERLSGVVERYRDGVPPSSAERCALRWSHSSATDRGSFDRGWEAREAEGSNRELRARYVAALEVVSDMIADTETPWNGVEINEANKTARHLRAQIGGRK